MKVYYAVISDSDLPDGLTRTPAEILAPGRLERSLAEIGDTLGPIFEILAVIAIIAACIFGLMVTGGSW